jgi:hypothetical protein
MIRVDIGGFPFQIKQRWDEVTFQEALKLHTCTKPLDVIRVLSVPNMPELNLHADLLLAVYELVSFVEEFPEPHGQPVKIADWSYREFELVRKAVAECPLGVTFALGQVADILGSSSINDGVRAVAALQQFAEDWADTGLFDAKDPTPEEIAAGVHKLQAYGAYGILQAVAKKYGMRPQDVEKESCVWVLTEWTYQMAERDFVANLQKTEK